MTNIYKKSQSIPRTARNNRIYPGEYTGGNAPVLIGTGINLDWVSVTPEKVTINRDTHIEGNLTASEEVVAWVAGAVTSDVLAGLTATAPLRKSSASNIVLDYNTSQFEVSGGFFQIKSGVLAPSAHSHLISDVTGLQTALDSKMVVHTHPYLPLAGGTMSNANLVTNLNAQYLNGIIGYDFNAYTKALKATGYDFRFFSGDGNHSLLIPYAGGLNYDGYTVYHSGNLTGDQTSGHFHTRINSVSVSDLNFAPPTMGLYYHSYISSASNIPVSLDNANAVLTMVSHPSGGVGTYGKQIAFADNDDLYMRYFVNGGFYSSWKKFYHSGNSNLSTVDWNASYLFVGDSDRGLGRSAWSGVGIFGKQGTDKVVTGYLSSATNGAVIGAHNYALNAWANLNISGVDIIFRNSEMETARISSDGHFRISKTGLASTFGSATTSTPNPSIASQTTHIQIVAGGGGSTNSTGLVFHNSGVSTAAVEYVNTDSNTGYFNFKSDDTVYNVRIAGNQVWNSGNMVASQLYNHNTNRDFPSGTFIETSIDYSVTNGDAFLLEIKANSYGSVLPVDIKIQGYIYDNTIINYGYISNGHPISGLVAINYNGHLCFWWPSQGYWHGYNVRCEKVSGDGEGGIGLNRVIGSYSMAKPTTAKEVKFSATQSWHTGNANKSDVDWSLKSVLSYNHDTGAILVSHNTSAGGPAQFIIQHSYSDVLIYNNRGSNINFSYNNINVGGSITASGFAGIGYTADPTSGNKLAVNGNAYFNGNITAQIATLTGCNTQSVIIKDSGNNTRWTVSYNTSTYALEFKNASGVLECSIDQSGNLKAKGEVTAYATI